MDRGWSQKLTLSFCSGELKKKGMFALYLVDKLSDSKYGKTIHTEVYVYSVCKFSVNVSYEMIALDKREYQENIFLISPQHMFSWRNKKNTNNFRLKKVPYLEVRKFQGSNQAVHPYSMIGVFAISL